MPLRFARDLEVVCTFMLRYTVLRSVDFELRDMSMVCLLKAVNPG